MSRKEKPAAMEEREETAAETPEEVVEELHQEEAETFTVTKEQMEKMEALAGQLEAANDKYLRLAAEYDNYRKRTAKEKEGTYQSAKADTIPFLWGFSSSPGWLTARSRLS